MPTFSNPLSKLTSALSSSSSGPKQIRNQRYKNLGEFTAWENWGTRPDHNNNNDLYIEVTGAFVKRCDYPAKLQQLIDFGWKTATVPTGPRTAPRVVIGANRVNGPIDLNNQPKERSPLRQGLNRRLAANWDHITKFEQVAAYTFRGDTRDPEAIKTAGGFFPPASRTDDDYLEIIAKEFYGYMNRREGLTLDAAGQANFTQQVLGFMRGQGQDGKLFAQYHLWRTLLENEEMHLQHMTNASFLKAYISTTRDIRKAREGAGGALGGGGIKQSKFGWIYALRIDSGFLLKTGVGGVTKKEAEIAHLGPIPWDNVYGFFGLEPKDNTVYLRTGFDTQDQKAFRLVLASLSASLSTD